MRSSSDANARSASAVNGRQLPGSPSPPLGRLSILVSFTPLASVNSSLYNFKSLVRRDFVGEAQPCCSVPAYGIAWNLSDTHVNVSQAYVDKLQEKYQASRSEIQDFNQTYIVHDTAISQSTERLGRFITDIHNFVGVLVAPHISPGYSQ